MKFTVNIEERINQEFEIEADSITNLHSKESYPFGV